MRAGSPASGAGERPRDRDEKIRELAMLKPDLIPVIDSCLNNVLYFRSEVPHATDRNSRGT